MAAHPEHGMMAPSNLLWGGLGTLAAYGEPDLCALAAAYAFGIARNHPFVDGNKRTSEVVSVTFLELNGLTVTADLADIVTTWLALADGSMTESKIADWLRQNTESIA